MLRIGLTGGIGSGKSTVAELFARRGVPVIDTDAIARELSQPGGAAYAAIVRTFGEQILDHAGNIDRVRLRERIFADPAARRQLEGVLHPRIRAETQARLARLDAPYCLIVVPLLIETDFAELVDRILVVDADEERQVARTMARGGLSRDEVQRILAAQSPRTARLARADDTIVNDADRGALEARVAALHQRYQTLAESH